MAKSIVDEINHFREELGKLVKVRVQNAGLADLRKIRDEVYVLEGAARDFARTIVDAAINAELLAAGLPTLPSSEIKEQRRGKSERPRRARRGSEDIIKLAKLIQATMKEENEPLSISSLAERLRLTPTQIRPVLFKLRTDKGKWVKMSGERRDAKWALSSKGEKESFEGFTK